MLKQSSKSFRALLAVVFAAFLCVSALAQNQAQSPAQSSAQTKKGSAGLSCDGALDIVPTKAMSFVRKRRPNKTDGKQQTPAPADSKPQPKPPSVSKSGR
ncbi:MAG: hypothetical protein ABI977_31905 [Acidobacteriota bacterium]